MELSNRTLLTRLGWKAVVWQDRVWEAYLHWRLGISTAGVIEPAGLGFDRANCHAYDPVYYVDFRRIVKALSIRPGIDVFVDFGSGKGRVLLLAARHRLRRVIGVELSPELDAVARENIRRAKGWLRCERVETVVADAARFDVPDDATILYFQNPFSESVLDAVLENIKVSLGRAPRQVLFVSHSHYENSVFEQQIRRCEWLRPHATVSLARGTTAWIYANVDRDASSRREH